jgi:PiT family inorganic phosphate transporter
VGGVMGGGIAAAGWAVVNWSTMGKIAASWVISPLLGGVIAALFLLFIKVKIINTENVLDNAKRFVPMLIALMSLAFITYLSLKGLKKIVKIDLLTALSIGSVFAIATYLYVKSYIYKKADSLKNNRDGVNDMFTIPLVFAAALLSFAHGANDVANAVGPLAAINDAIMNGGISTKVGIPFWVMAIGAVGIAVGLALYGPKLIKTVGNEITELDKIRAFSVAMAAAITVIIASQLKLPVSSTHIAVGGIFGVGLLREWLNRRNFQESDIDELAKLKEEHEGIEDFINRFNKASTKQKEQMLSTVKNKKSDIVIETHLNKKERKMIAKLFRQELVKRSEMSKIIAAWVITVPASALLSAFLFYAIKGFMS